MRALTLHRWDVSPAEARRIQQRLAARVVRRDASPQTAVRTVAGADVAIDAARGRAIAGVILYRFPEMRELERRWAARPLRFPYVPGLLSFREAPALVAAFARLGRRADVIFCDAQGIAHPRRLGLASHLGLLLGTATIGCAKSRLIGAHDPPGPERGARAPLTDGGETVGAVLRTRAGVRPIYVSIGHRISLARAVALVLAVSDGWRIPRPTREADGWVGEVKRRSAKQQRSKAG